MRLSIQFSLIKAALTNNFTTSTRHGCVYLSALPRDIEDLSDVKYRRIYHETKYPNAVTISGKTFDRKHMDPKNCTTVGWVLFRDGKILRVEGV
jgi:hypothetical protein